MYCQNCGKELPNKGAFCPYCGTNLRPARSVETPASNSIQDKLPEKENTSDTLQKEPVAPRSEKKAMPKKTKQKLRNIVIIVAAACFAFFGLLVPYINVVTGGTFGIGQIVDEDFEIEKADLPESYLEPIYDIVLDETYLIYNGELVDERIKGSITISGASDDMTKYILTTDNAMYYFDRGAIKYISDNVIRYHLSPNGTYAIFFNTNSVYVYDFPSMTEMKILGSTGTPDYPEDHDIVFSPDSSFAIVEMNDIFYRYDHEAERIVHATADGGEQITEDYVIPLTEDNGSKIVNGSYAFRSTYYDPYYDNKTARYSPNRKNFAYIAFESEYSGEGNMYFFSDGETTKISSEGKPLFVLDDGTICYYDVEQEALYSMKGSKGDKTKLISCGDYIDILALNESQDQVLVQLRTSSNTDKIYFIENGNKITYVADGSSIYFIKSTTENIGGFDYDWAPWLDRERIVDGIIGSKSLKERILYLHLSNEIIFLDENGSSKRIIELGTDRLTSSSLSEDGKTLYYYIVPRSKREKLKAGIYCKRLDSKEGTSQVAGEASTFVVSKDGDKVYYFERDGGLYYASDVSEPILVTNGITNVKDQRISHIDGSLYYIDIADFDEEAGVGKLYNCTNENDLQLIAENVAKFDANYYRNMYYVKTGIDKYDVYIGTSGHEFSLFLEGVNCNISHVHGVYRDDVL